MIVEFTDGRVQEMGLMPHVEVFYHPTLVVVHRRVFTRLVRWRLTEWIDSKGRIRHKAERVDDGPTDRERDRNSGIPKDSA
jgi:hypothetical protein